MLPHREIIHIRGGSINLGTSKDELSFSVALIE